MHENGKAGFITLFGVQLLKEKKNITNGAAKILEAQHIQIQRAIRTSGAPSTRRETSVDKKVMPIRVSFDFPQFVSHSFSDSSPSVQVNLALSIQNLLQSDICGFSCEIVANQSWKKGKGRYSLVDVSEGESFLWAGKTTHKLQHFKANVSIIL